MRVVVAINNYNNGDYLQECLRSVCMQDDVDVILIVDDGSTDNSISVIKKFLEVNNDNRVKLIEKDNAGQMSAINAIVSEIKEEDVVFLMDGDDLYPRLYVHNVLKFFLPDVDFYCSEGKIFKSGQHSYEELIASNCPDDSEISPLIIHLSSSMSKFMRTWIGTPTSGLVLRGRLLRMILPFPFYSSWRTRADDVIVLGASVLGSKKMYLDGNYFLYRNHGRNVYLGAKGLGVVEKVRRRHDLSVIISFYCSTYGLDKNPSLLDVSRERMIFPVALKKKIYVEGLWLNLLRLITKSAGVFHACIIGPNIRRDKNLRP